MSVDENYHLCVFDYVEKDKGYSKLIFEIGWLGEWGGGRGGGAGEEIFVVVVVGSGKTKGHAMLTKKCGEKSSCNV